MVHAKAQNILASVYQGRLSDGRETGAAEGTSVSGYSDTYALDPMRAGRPGKAAGSGLSGFEIVPEGKLDFEYYKNRSEFAEDHGQGDLFGNPRDMMRPGTPSSMWGGSDTDSRPGTPTGGMMFSGSKGGNASASVSGVGGDGIGHGPGYASPSAQYSPRMAPYGSPAMDYPSRTRSPYGLVTGNDSTSNLVQSAAPIASPLVGYYANDAGSRSGSIDHGTTSFDRPRAAAPGSLGGGPQGYGNLPQAEPEYEDPMSYNYFRGGTGRSRYNGGN